MATAGCSVLTAPILINVTKSSTDIDHDITTISWDAPCGGVDSYTFYHTDASSACYNVTLNADATSFTLLNGVTEIQIAAHQNDMTTCSKGMNS